FLSFLYSRLHQDLPPFPTRRSSDLKTRAVANWIWLIAIVISGVAAIAKEQSSSARIDQTAFVPLGGIDQWISIRGDSGNNDCNRSEEHTSELQSRGQLVCRLLLAKK